MNPDTNFTIRTFQGGYDKNLTYLITCSHSNAVILIDASIEFDLIKPFIKNNPIACLITHSHKDHIAYLESYLKQYPNLKILAHSESNHLYNPNNFIPLDDYQNFKIGELKFIAMHTPGHYYDSICYKLNPLLFTGDTMFVGRTGRVVSSRSDIELMYDSIYNKILQLPKNIHIYPGHNYGHIPSITLQENINCSPLLQAKNMDDFKNIMNEYEKNR